MEQNKTGKYLKYAIGEIVLVVIGILIALSINNWNEQRKDRIEEKTLYLRVVNDLKIDDDKLSILIDDMKVLHNILFQVFKESIGTAVFDKNINYEELRWGERFNPIIKENYNIKITTISNEIIKEELNQYFKLETITKEAIEGTNKLRRVNLRSFLAKNAIINTKVLFLETSYEFEPILDLDFINYENLKNQYGNNELDQILGELRIDTAWAITKILDLRAANKKLIKLLENK